MKNSHTQSPIASAGADPKLAKPPKKDDEQTGNPSRSETKLQNENSTKVQDETKAEAVKLATPNDWFAKKFPSIAAEFGDAVYIKPINSVPTVAGISEDFFAATLGMEANPARPLVYDLTSRSFCRYVPDTGIFERIEKAGILNILSEQFRCCASQCQTNVDLMPLNFKYARAASLGGIVEKAKALLGVGSEFFETGSVELIACRNGILRQADRTLLPFSPTYRFRNKLAVDFVAKAKCNRFLDEVLKPATPSHLFRDRQ